METSCITFIKFISCSLLWCHYRWYWHQTFLFSNYLLLAYPNDHDFCILALHPLTLLNSFMISFTFCQFLRIFLCRQLCHLWINNILTPLPNNVWTWQCFSFVTLPSIHLLSNILILCFIHPTVRLYFLYFSLSSYLTCIANLFLKVLQWMGHLV